jgi:hypothetical protein
MPFRRTADRKGASEVPKEASFGRKEEYCEARTYAEKATQRINLRADTVRI